MKQLRAFKKLQFVSVLLVFFALSSSVFAKTPIPSGYNNLEMYYRHKDIDRYLFQDHKKDLEVRGLPSLTQVR